MKQAYSKLSVGAREAVRRYGVKSCCQSLAAYNLGDGLRRIADEVLGGRVLDSAQSAIDAGRELSLLYAKPTMCGRSLIGGRFDRHMQVAWGRHVYRLLHGGRDCGLYLRDLPLSLWNLAERGYTIPLDTYREEVSRNKSISQI